MRTHLESVMPTNTLASVPEGLTAPENSVSSVRYIFISEMPSRMILPSITWSAAVRDTCPPLAPATPNDDASALRNTPPLSLLISASVRVMAASAFVT